MLEKAILLLIQLKARPQMYASSKESLIMRVSTILEMALEDSFLKAISKIENNGGK